MTGKGNEAYEKFNREFGEKNAELIESLVIPRALAFDYAAPLPSMRPHGHDPAHSWEPAARRYRDIDETEKAQP